MAMTPDQRATLQLLLERGQTYSDLATLLAVDEAEVRDRARAALTELGGADPDRNVALTDYLLGQADPIGRADASRHLRDDPADHALATALAERLRETFPDAELPRLPGEPRQRRRRRAKAAEGRELTGTVRRSSGLSPSQTRLVVALGSAAVLLIAVVLAVTGTFGGDGDDEVAAEADPATTAPADEQAVPVELRPARGSDAGGVVVFGFASADQPFIEFQIRNLEPPTRDDVYVLWFRSGKRQGFPVPTPVPVQADGTVNERIAVPAEVLAFAQQADSVAIALNNRRQLDRDIDQAIEAGQGALTFPGGTVLAASIRGNAAEQ
jgi:hypothetical protein